METDKDRRSDVGYVLGVDIPELAARTGLSEFLLYAQANAGQLAGCRRIGRRFLVHVPTFEKWLADGWGDDINNEGDKINNENE